MDQQHKLHISTDILCEIYQEKSYKVVITNIINQCKQEFDIDNGLVLKYSTLTQLNQDIIQEINKTYHQDEILSLISPIQLNNQIIQMVVSLSNDGIYEKIKREKELFRGEEYYIGLPSGQNQQLIQIQGQEITINTQSFPIYENMKIVFVKKFQDLDDRYKQIQMVNPSMFSSHKHAHITVKNGRIFLIDGFQQQASKNGVWILVKYQIFSNQIHYCFKDFRLAIGLNK